MADLTPEQTTSVLTSKESAMLSFVDKDGYPRLLPCWFMWDGEAFCTTSEPDKFHVKCLRRDPRAGMCIEVATGVLPPEPGTTRNHWQVKGHGDMEIVEDIEGTVGAAIRNRYLGGDAVPAEQPPLPGAARLVLRLKPRRLSAHGGGMTFAASGALSKPEHRFE